MNVPSDVRVLFSNDRSLYTNKTAMLEANSVSNIAFSGGGILDGQGPNWWKRRNKGKKDSCFRPKFFSTSHATHVLMQGITWQDSPDHVLEMYWWGVLNGRNKVGRVLVPNLICLRRDAKDWLGKQKLAIASL